MVNGRMDAAVTLKLYPADDGHLMRRALSGGLSFGKLSGVFAGDPACGKAGSPGGIKKIYVISTGFWDKVAEMGGKIRTEVGRP